MEQERNYTQRDLDAAYSQGWRAGAPRAKEGGGGWLKTAAGIVMSLIITACIVAATLFDYRPFQAQSTTKQEAATAMPTQPARATSAPEPTPIIIVQTVREGQAPQPVSVPAQPAPVDSPAAAPKPQIIVLHQNDGHGAPIVTGSGACQVAKGARRCGK
jgi:hypothetical protein